MAHFELCGTSALRPHGISIVTACHRQRLGANTGTANVGRVEIGDTAAMTWSGNFDDVVVDQTPG